MYNALTNGLALLILLVIPVDVLAQYELLPGEPAIAYWEVGTGKTTTIVLHGGPGISHNYMRPEWERLAAASRVVFYDQRGCGQSERADSHIWRDHLEDLKRLIDHLAPGERVVLAGSSWGSKLALLFAVEYPDLVAGLILSGVVPWKRQQVPPPAHSVQEMIAMLERARESRESSTKIDVARQDSLRSEQNARRRMTALEREAEAYRVDSLFLQRISRCLDIAIETASSEQDIYPIDRLREVQAPALILMGAAEHRIPDGSEELHSVLPNSSLAMISEGGHDPWYNNPKMFFETVFYFLKEQEIHQ